MIIGLAKEIKTGENRVGLTPKGVNALVNAGHTVLVETKSGENSGFSDSDYIKEGAKIVSKKDVFSADMIIKVKEPLEQEFCLLRENQIIFTYLHLAADKRLTRELLDRKVIAIAYETVEKDGKLPLLVPMSEIAGKMAVQVGMHYLERTYGGSGKLLSEVPGISSARVTVLGGGTAGTNAAKLAHAIGARVTILEKNPARLDFLRKILFGDNLTISDDCNVEKVVAESDLIIGTVAIPGTKTPKIVSREIIKKMIPGSVIVDVSIDQGGCFETSRPTTHKNPIYIEEGVIHYCVTNIPGAVPNTSTLALTNATLPYILVIANKGLKEAVKSDPALSKGINCFKGKLTNKSVAEAFGLKYEPLAIN
jgi:alanine dehydrogenase